MSYELKAFYRIYLGKQFTLELNTFGWSVVLDLFFLSKYLASQILCMALTKLQYLLTDIQNFLDKN